MKQKCVDLVSDSFEVILMKSVNWWESPCPKWDCFWHDKMQINAAWGLIWLAGLELSQAGENSWRHCLAAATTQSDHTFGV